MIMIRMFKVIHYCLLMYLKTLETNVLKYMNLTLLIWSAPGLAWQAYLKKTEVELELLTNTDMLLMAEMELEAEYVKQYTDMLKQIIIT